MLRRKNSSFLAIGLLVLATAGAFAETPCRPFVGKSLGRTLDGLGHSVFLPTTAKKLTDTPTSGVALDAWAQGAVISVETQSIRYWTDGTVPTSSSGVLVTAGQVIIFKPENSAQMRSFTFIEVASGAKVSVSSCW